MSVSCQCCVMSGRGLCDRSITRPEEFYEVWRDPNLIEEPRRGGHGPLGLSGHDRRRGWGGGKQTPVYLCCSVLYFNLLTI